MTGSTEALRAAMDRLLAGAPSRTDGGLTKKNLYLEAEVSRATMNRATDLLAEWDTAVAEALGVNPDAKQPLTEEKKLERELRRVKKERRELRARLNGAASLIAVLAEDNRYLRERLKHTPNADLVDLEERRLRARDSR